MNRNLLNPVIAFCTTCKGRLEHLKLTLRKNINDNKDYLNCKFIILDYGGDLEIEEFLRNNFQAELASGKLVSFRYDTCCPFHMAHAKNMAHRSGIFEGADILVNLDSDNFTGPGFASYIANEFVKAKEPIFICAFVARGSVSGWGICGRIALSKNAFLKTGGYDERFNTYSPDDADLILRLQRLGYKPVTLKAPFIDCINHSDQIRFKEYPHVKSGDALDLKTRCQYADTTIVNYGKVGLGLVIRNFGTDRIELGCMPEIDFRNLPTRIFGIGLHKTATTSLADALKILGFDTIHWSNPDWAKSIWDEMASAGRSITVERHFAILDLPIALLYSKLDIVYPGSKFILTVRNEKEWLASIEKHWNNKDNVNRGSWDVDMMSHRLHNLLYGQKSFHAGMFLETYKQHNRETQDYFKYRPKDLLVLDASKNDEWNKLGRFLNVPVPLVPYPHTKSAEGAIANYLR